MLRFKVGYVMSLLRRYSAKLCRITLGFAAMALGMAIAKQSYCLSPWNILNDGISHTFSITIGQANIIVGLVILALDLLLRETFGFGMLLNILLLGTFTDIFLWLNGVFSIMPKIQSVPLQMVFCLLSLILNGLACTFICPPGWAPGRGTLFSCFLPSMSLFRSESASWP